MPDTCALICSMLSAARRVPCSCSTVASESVRHTGPSALARASSPSAEPATRAIVARSASTMPSNERASSPSSSSDSKVGAGRRSPEREPLGRGAQDRDRHRDVARHAPGQDQREQHRHRHERGQQHRRSGAARVEVGRRDRGDPDRAVGELAPREDRARAQPRCCRRCRSATAARATCSATAAGSSGSAPSSATSVTGIGIACDASGCWTAAICSRIRVGRQIGEHALRPALRERLERARALIERDSTANSTGTRQAPVSTRQELRRGSTCRGASRRRSSGLAHRAGERIAHARELAALERSASSASRR